MAVTVTDYQTEVNAAIERFEKAAGAKDAAAIASLYTEDATLLPPGQPAIKGRQGIQAFWQGFLDAGAADPKIKSIEVGGAGDLVYEIGEFSATMPLPTGGTAPGTGKYVVVFERQPDGTLRMKADIFNSNA